MDRSISKRNSSKASTSKPPGKPPPRDKSIGLDTDICLYEIEDGAKTEEVEYAEILIIQDKILPETKKNFVKSNFPYINVFDHMVPAVVRAMRALTIWVFEHLGITFALDVDKQVKYNQRLLRWSSLKIYKAFL